uniref:Uncharacterized protein n=1 Tax=Cajanus cajan TaxID=3821 RepID=A0A151TYS2_CAJCA|nr:hypothetical protein KK1_004820 [Cajanus cajan]
MGGALNANLRGDCAFRNFVDQCSLMDIGFNGSAFTWKRGQLYERLDRCLANFDWRVAFPEASLTHLNPLKYHHTPILLQLNLGVVRCSYRCPFRFEAVWLTHDEFPEFIQREWKANEPWNQKVGHIKKSLLEWNLNTFGNVFKAKK